MATNFAYERMIGELKFGEHLCCIYQNREQQMQMVIPFLKVGLERGEQCFYITDENSEADILKALGAYGLKPQPYLKQGQLVFLTAKDAYLKNGVFDPERMIALLEQTLERALKQGYSGLRVTGEMTWVFTKLPGTERLVEYEARLNTFFPGRKVTAICQFNETRFDPKVLLNVLRTHRLVLVRDQVCENFYYLPPEEFLATENAASTQAYHHAVEHLIQRVRLLQEIKDQRNAYEQLLEGISDGFLALDDDLKVTYFNSGAERILRRQRQEVLGQKLSQAFPEIRGSVFEKNCRRAIDEKIPCQFETQFTIPPYKSTYQVNIYPRPQGTAILFQNVSERKQTEEELKQSEQRYKFLVNNSNELILILSKTGKIIFANKKAAQVSGYSEEEIIGQSIVKFLTKDSIPRAFFALTQEFLGKPQPVMEVKIKTKSGEIRYLEVAESSTFVYEQGQLVGILINILDITERKQAMEALQRSEEKYRNLFENARDVIVTFDLKGNVTSINKAAREFGFKEEEFIGKNMLTFVSEKYWSKLLKELTKIARGKPVEGEIELSTPKGEKIAEYRGNPIKVGKKVVGFQIILRDVTERKRVEEEIRRQTAVLEAINKVLRETLVCETEEEMARTCLAVAEELTGSKFGFIGELNPAGQFDTLALSNPGWVACKMPRSDATRMIKDMKIRGIWGRVLKAEQSLIVNDPASHPDRVGIPEGHPPLKSFLGVPLKHGGRTMGMIALANKESGYDQADQQAIEALSVAFVEALNRKRAEERLSFRLTLEKALANISTRFVALSSEQLDESIHLALEELGRLDDADRAYVFLFSPDGKTMDNTHEWCSVGVTPQIDNLQGLMVDDFPWWMQKLRNNEVIVIPNVEDLPEEARAEKELLQAQQIRSLLVVPMYSQQRLLGYIGFDDVRKSRQWPREDVVLLQTFAEIVVGALERKKSEEALRESEQRYRLLVEQAPIGIVSTDANGQVTSANPRILSIFGLPGESESPIMSEEAIKQFNVLSLPALVQSGISDLFRKALEEKTLQVSEQEYTSRWGKTSSICFQVVPALADQGQVAGTVAIVEDISERKKLEAQLRQAQKMEAVGQLAGGIAHDFNNLLTGILGYSELLLMDMKPGQAGYEELSQIKNVSLRARDLVQGLLAFSRRAESHPRPINLNNEIQTVRKLLERTIPKTIEIQFRLAENLKIINADPSQMHQVLMNLAVNAHDAMPDGGQLLIETENVTLDEEYCRSHLGAKPGPYVLLSVSDTGIGMEQTIQNHIFEPFFTTKEKGKGTGLGLAIVWGIVKSLQGYIMVYSEPGQGTTFKIYLPVIESLVTESVEDTAVDLPRGQETILLVDDEEVIRTLGKRLLEKYGYHVLLAQNGREALELYEKQKSAIDLVLLDLIMPQMDGKTCLLELQKINPGIKVVLASGYSISGQVQHVFENGCQGFVKKPYQVTQLLHTVRQVLDAE